MDNTDVRGGVDLSPAAQKRKVAELRVRFPARSANLRLLERCLEDSKYSEDPTCLFVGGISGTGKSSLVESFESDHPRTRGDEVDRIPVLVASLPAASSRKDAATRILLKLGDGRAGKGGLIMLTHRLLEYLKRCEVQMVVLDEFQHLIDSESQKVIAKTADWIKELIIEAKIPFALVGLPDAVRIFDANSQLSRRFTRRTLIQPFDWAPDPEPSDLRTFLGLVDAGLPFPVSAGLDHPDTVKWFHRNTDGVMGRVMNIVREAAILAIDKGANRIQGEDLVAALDQMTIASPEIPKRKRQEKMGRSAEPNIGEVLRAR